MQTCDLKQLDPQPQETGTYANAAILHQNFEGLQGVVQWTPLLAKVVVGEVDRGMQTWKGEER